MSSPNLDPKRPARPQAPSSRHSNHRIPPRHFRPPFSSARPSRFSTPSKRASPTPSSPCFKASRAWPFLPPRIAGILPSPLNRAGPTFNAVTSVLKIDPEEIIDSLLRRVAEQQKQLNKHQHVPFSMRAQLNENDREV